MQWAERPPERYLAAVVAGAGRPFRHRSRVGELLGRPGAAGTPGRAVHRPGPEMLHRVHATLVDARPEQAGAPATGHRPPDTGPPVFREIAVPEPAGRDPHNPAPAVRDATPDTPAPAGHAGRPAPGRDDRTAASTAAPVGGGDGRGRPDPGGPVGTDVRGAGRAVRAAGDPAHPSSPHVVPPTGSAPVDPGARRLPAPAASSPFAGEAPTPASATSVQVTGRAPAAGPAPGPHPARDVPSPTPPPTDPVAVPDRHRRTDPRRGTGEGAAPDTAAAPDTGAAGAARRAGGTGPDRDGAPETVIATPDRAGHATPVRPAGSWDGASRRPPVDRPGTGADHAPVASPSRPDPRPHRVVTDVRSVRSGVGVGVGVGVEPATGTGRDVTSMPALRTRPAHPDARDAPAGAPVATPVPRPAPVPPPPRPVPPAPAVRTGGHAGAADVRRWGVSSLRRVGMRGPR